MGGIEVRGKELANADGARAKDGTGDGYGEDRSGVLVAGRDELPSVAPAN